MTDRIDISARILATGETRPPCRTIGYVTSAAETPGAGNIALALIEGGTERMGETVRLYAEGRITEAEKGGFLSLANKGLRAGHAKRILIAGTLVILCHEAPSHWLVGVERSRATYFHGWLTSLDII